MTPSHSQQPSETSGIRSTSLPVVASSTVTGSRLRSSPPTSLPAAFLSARRSRPFAGVTSRILSSTLEATANRDCRSSNETGHAGTQFSSIHTSTSTYVTSSSGPICRQPLSRHSVLCSTNAHPLRLAMSMGSASSPDEKSEAGDSTDGSRPRSSSSWPSSPGLTRAHHASSETV